MALHRRYRGLSVRTMWMPFRGFPPCEGVEELTDHSHLPVVFINPRIINIH